MRRQTIFNSACLLSLCVLLLTSCGRGGAKKLHVIYIVDLSASTVADSRGEALKSVQDSLEAKALRRGDTLTVIPVTSDALTESQGSVLRFQLSERREAYDADLQRLIKEAKGKLLELQTAADSKPYKFSDILGATNIAAEEFAGDTDDVRRVLVILSDYIQDDRVYNFKVDPRLADEKLSKKLALKVGEGKSQSFRGVDVYLGVLRSSDLKGLSASRRDAIQTFWSDYFGNGGAKSVSFATDGPGQLARIFK